MRNTLLQSLTIKRIFFFILCVNFTLCSYAQTMHNNADLPSVEIHLDALSQFRKPSHVSKEKYTKRNTQENKKRSPFSVQKTSVKQRIPHSAPPILPKKESLPLEKNSVAPPSKNTDQKLPEKEDTSKKSLPFAPERVIETSPPQVIPQPSLVSPKENISKKEDLSPIVAPTLVNKTPPSNITAEKPLQPITLPQERPSFLPPSVEKDVSSSKTTLPSVQPQSPSPKIPVESKEIQDAKPQNHPLITPPSFTPLPEAAPLPSQKTIETPITKPIPENILNAPLPASSSPQQKMQENTVKPEEPSTLLPIPVEAPPPIFPTEPSITDEPVPPSLPPLPAPLSFKTSSVPQSSSPAIEIQKNSEETATLSFKKTGFTPPPLVYAKNKTEPLEDKADLPSKSEGPKPHFIMSNMALPENIPPSSQEKDDSLATIDFKKGETALPENAEVKALLAQMVENFKSKKTNRFTIVSYANDANDHPDSARRISLHRAIAIRKNLIENGIESAYINVRAMGSTLDANKNKDIVYIQQGTS